MLQILCLKHNFLLDILNLLTNPFYLIFVSSISLVNLLYKEVVKYLASASYISAMYNPYFSLNN